MLTRYILSILCILMVTLVPRPALALTDVVKQVGVWFIGGSYTYEMWSPTFVDYLNEQNITIGNERYRFNLTMLTFNNIYTLQANGFLDYALTNPSFTACADLKYGIDLIATLINNRVGYALDEFGATIVVRADSDIYTVDDLYGKVWGAVGFTAFGGGQCGWRELEEQGFSLLTGFKQLKYTSSMSGSLDLLDDHEADVISVRTDHLELRNSKNASDPNSGYRNMSNYRVLFPKVYDDFPFQISTRLYPEFGLYDLKANLELSMEITKTLFALPANSTALAAGAYEGWRVPRNYKEMYELFDVIQNLDEHGHCLETKDVYTLLSCPSDTYLVSEDEYLHGCDEIGLVCDVPGGCICSPCRDCPKGYTCAGGRTQPSEILVTSSFAFILGMCVVGVVFLAVLARYYVIRQNLLKTQVDYTSLTMLVDNINDIIIVCNFANQNIVLCNPEATLATGYNAADLQSMRCEDFIFKEERNIGGTLHVKRKFCTLQDIFSEQKGTTQQQSQDLAQREADSHHRHRRRKYSMDSQSSYGSYNGDTSSVNNSPLQTPILRTSRRIYKNNNNTTMLEQIVSANTLMPPSQQHAATAAQHGHAHAQHGHHHARGHSQDDMNREQVLRTSHHQGAAPSRGGRPKHSNNQLKQFDILCKDGKTFQAEANCSTFYVKSGLGEVENNENNQMAVIVLRDVSRKIKARNDLKRAKKAAEQANNEKSLFLAFICHELRNPLHGIAGLNNIIRNSVSEEPLLGLCQSIDECATLMNTIVNDMLDLSKIEAGATQLEYVPLSLNAIINDIELWSSVASKNIRDKRDDMKDKTVDISFDCKNLVENEFIVYGDPTRLRQILMNLLSNAIKFTLEGYIHISASIVAQEGGGGRHDDDDSGEEGDSVSTSNDTVTVLFSVKDSGIGIDPKVIPKLFTSYAQAHASTARKHGGTGLGLCIVAGLLQQMGSQIHVESVLGEGSHFYFQLTFDIAKNTLIENVVTTPLSSPFEVTRALKAPSLSTNTNTNTNNNNSQLSSPSISVNGVRFHDARDVTRESKQKAAAGDSSSLLLQGVKELSPVREQPRDLILAPPVTDASSVADGDDVELEIITKQEEAKTTTTTRTLTTNNKSSPLRSPTSKSSFNDLKLDSMTQEFLLENSILVVDDVRINLKIVTQILKKIGVRAVTAMDGEDAMSKLEKNYTDAMGGGGLDSASSEETKTATRRKKTSRSQNVPRIGLVMTDINMPNMNGKELIQSLRQDERFQHIKVLVFTGNAVPDDVKQLYQLGADRVLLKPFQAEQLVKELSETIRDNDKMSSQ